MDYSDLIVWKDGKVLSETLFGFSKKEGKKEEKIEVTLVSVNLKKVVNFISFHFCPPLKIITSIHINNYYDNILLKMLTMR